MVGGILAVEKWVDCGVIGRFDECLSRWGFPVSNHCLPWDFCLTFMQNLSSPELLRCGTGIGDMSPLDRRICAGDGAF